MDSYIFVYLELNVSLVSTDWYIVLVLLWAYFYLPDPWRVPENPLYCSLLAKSATTTTTTSCFPLLLPFLLSPPPSPLPTVPARVYMQDHKSPRARRPKILSIPWNQIKLPALYMQTRMPDIPTSSDLPPGVGNQVYLRLSLPVKAMKHSDIKKFQKGFLLLQKVVSMR